MADERDSSSSDLGRRMDGSHKFKLSDFGTVGTLGKGQSIFKIDPGAPVGRRGSGITMTMLGVAAAAAGHAFIQKGDKGKKVKLDTPPKEKPKVQNLKREKIMAYGGKAKKKMMGGSVKKYARGGGIRKAKTYG